MPRPPAPWLQAQAASIVASVSHLVSVMTTHLCPHAQRDTDSTEMEEPIGSRKLHRKKQQPEHGTELHLLMQDSRDHQHHFRSCPGQTGRPVCHWEVVESHKHVTEHVFEFTLTARAQLCQGQIFLLFCFVFCQPGVCC